MRPLGSTNSPLLDKSRPRAFSLVETVLAIGIIVFGILAVIGLLPLGLRLDRTSLNETLGVSIGELVVADMRQTDPGGNASPIFGLRNSPYREVDGRAVLRSTVDAINVTAIETIFVTQSGEVVKGPEEALFRIRVQHVAGPGINGVPADSLRPLESTISVTWPPELDPEVSSVTRPESVLLRATFQAP